MQCQGQLFIALAVAAIASSPLAQGLTETGGQDGSLSIHVVVTAKGEQLFDSWDRPTGKPFSVVPVRVAKRGEFLSAVVLFKNCRPDAAGNCNVEMDINPRLQRTALAGNTDRRDLNLRRAGAAADEPPCR